MPERRGSPNGRSIKTRTSPQLQRDFPTFRKKLETDRHIDVTCPALSATLLANKLFWARRFHGLVPVASDDDRPGLSAFER